MSSMPCSPTTEPTSPPSPSDATSPTRPIIRNRPGNRPRSSRRGLSATGTSSTSAREDLTVGLTKRAHRRVEAAPPSSPTCSRRSGPLKERGDPTPNVSPPSNTSCAPCCVQRCGKPTTMPVTPGSDIATAPPAKPRSRAGGSATPKIASPPYTPRVASLSNSLNTLQAEACRLADFANPASDHLGLDQLEHAELHWLDQLIDAVDSLDDLGCRPSRRCRRTGRGRRHSLRHRPPGTAVGLEGR